MDAKREQKIRNLHQALCKLCFQEDDTNVVVSALVTTMLSLLASIGDNDPEYRDGVLGVFSHLPEIYGKDKREMVPPGNLDGVCTPRRLN